MELDLIIRIDNRFDKFMNHPHFRGGDYLY